MERKRGAPVYFHGRKLDAVEVKIIDNLWVFPHEQQAGVLRVLHYAADHIPTDQELHHAKRNKAKQEAVATAYHTLRNGIAEKIKEFLPQGAYENEEAVTRRWSFSVERVTQLVAGESKESFAKALYFANKQQA